MSRNQSFVSLPEKFVRGMVTKNFFPFGKFAFSLCTRGKWPLPNVTDFNIAFAIGGNDCKITIYMLLSLLKNLGPML
jgi:hypothetical protein